MILALIALIHGLWGIILTTDSHVSFLFLFILEILLSFLFQKINKILKKCCNMKKKNVVAQYLIKWCWIRSLWDTLYFFLPDKAHPHNFSQCCLGYLFELPFLGPGQEFSIRFFTFYSWWKKSTNLQPNLISCRTWIGDPNEINLDFFGRPL